MRLLKLCRWAVIWMPLLVGTSVAEVSREDFARPLTIPFPEDRPYDPQIATLGKMLYFDPRLSGAQNMSCASCHNPSFGWETPVDLAIGAANIPLTRHAPTVINLAWVNSFFWDGRAATLEDQAAGPITAKNEMNASFREVVGRLSRIAGYEDWFNRLFPGEGITQRSITVSLSTYERTIVSGWAPFDRWVEGDEGAISLSAKRGFEIFVGKANCSSCHNGWNFTDGLFHDIGLATDDIGRAALDKDNPQAKHAFKTPGLRNITLRAPYMHNGAFHSLREVLLHYSAGGLPRPSLSPTMQPFPLSDNDIRDLEAFLNSLTDDNTHVSAPVLPAN